MSSPLALLSMPGTLGLLPVLALLAKATLLLLLSLAGASALRRTSASARHIVWCGALAALVVLPMLSWLAPWRLEVLPRQLGSMEAPVGAGAASSGMVAAPTGITTRAASTGITARAARAGQEPTLSDPAPGPERQPPQALSRSALEHGHRDASALYPPTSLASSQASVVRDVSQGPAVSGVGDGLASAGTVWLVLLAFWLVGALLFLARLVAGAMAVRRIVRGARSLTAPAWTRPLWETADRLELARVPRLLVSDRISMPFACGLVHPAIVLPLEAGGWSDERRRAVFFHELAHVRRRDLIGHTLGRVACALYWFHPLVWTAARRLRVEAERACDDLVLAAGTRASEYADHLLQILTSVRNAPAPTAALAMARRKEFEGRMLAILDPEVPRRAPGRVQSAALVLGFVALTVSVSAMAPAGAPVPRHTAHMGQRGDTSIASRTGERPTAPREQTVDTRMPMSSTRPQPARDGDQGLSRTRVGQPAGTAIDPLGTLQPIAASADTGEDIAGAVRAMIDTIVGSVVPQVVGATTAAVGSVSDGLATGWYADAIADRSIDAAQRAIRQSMGAYGAAWSSAGRSQPDSATTALLVQLLRTDSAVSVRKTAAWALAQRDGYGVGSRHCVWSKGCWADAKALKVAIVSNLCSSVSSYTSTNCGARTRAARDGDDEHTVSDAQVRREDSTITAALAAALVHDRSASVREMAAWGLSRRDGPVAVQALGDAVQRDRDTQVKATAAWALGEIEDSSATPALDGALADPSATVRARAAWALGQIEPPNAPRGLTRALGDSDSQVRLMAAWALGQIADSTTVSALSAALSTEKDEKVKQAELRAIFVLGQDSDAALRELLKSSDPEVRVRATRALAGYGLGAWPMPMPMPMPKPRPMP